MTKPWTEAHRREALRRTYEIAAELAGAGSPYARGLAEDPFVASEDGWRGWLAAGIDAARINREVRRVRALAEGRLVRVTTWCMRANGSTCDFTSAADARQWRGHHEPMRAVVRVTRVRRAA